MQSVLIHLLQFLGFGISWQKCSSPSKCTRYLGIEFDAVRMQLRILDDKLAILYKEINFFEGKSRATLKQIQKLCGTLAHCSKIVRGWRTFSHRAIALLHDIQGRSRIRLSACFKADLSWWRSLASFFNGVTTMVQHNYGEGPVLFTDASEQGYGLVLGSDWKARHFVESGSQLGLDGGLPHAHWKDVVKPLVVGGDDNINFWELIPVWQALLRFAPSHRNQHLVLFPDNTQVVFMVNAGKSSYISCMCLLREIFWICVFFNVYLTAR